MCPVVRDTPTTRISSHAWRADIRPLQASYLAILLPGGCPGGADYGEPLLTWYSTRLRRPTGRRGPGVAGCPSVTGRRPAPRKFCDQIHYACSSYRPRSAQQVLHPRMSTPSEAGTFAGLRVIARTAAPRATRSRTTSRPTVPVAPVAPVARIMWAPVPMGIPRRIGGFGTPCRRWHRGRSPRTGFYRGAGGE